MSIFTSEPQNRRSVRIPAQRGPRGRHRVLLPQQPASRHLRYLPRLALVIDLVAILTAEVVAGFGRNLLPAFTASSLDYVPRIVLAGPLVALGWVGVIALLGGYDRSVFGAGTDEFKRVLNASFVSAALVGVGCYLLQFDLSRGFFNLAILGGSLFVLLGRLTLRLALARARRRGHLQQRVLVVGTSSHVDEVVSVLSREKRLGYDVVGAAVPGRAPRQQHLRWRPGDRLTRRGRGPRAAEPLRRGLPRRGGGRLCGPDAAYGRRPQAQGRPGHHRAEHHRRLPRAHQGPPCRRAATHPRGQAPLGGRCRGREAVLRHRRLEPVDPDAQPHPALRCAQGLALRPRPDPVPPRADRTRGRPLRLPQVPHHGP